MNSFLSIFTRIFILATLALSFDAMALSSKCEVEVRQHCGNVRPGAGRQTNCVVKNKARFSTLCRLEIHALIERRRLFSSACMDDAKGVCPNMQIGKGRLYACLKFNEDRLSPACKRFVE